MTLGLAHELSLALATSLAFLVALLGGATSPFAWGVLLAPWLSFLLTTRNRTAPALSGTVIALASLGLGVATIVQRGAEAAVLAGGYALMGLLVARLITRASLAHDLQALLLSLLLVVAGAVLNVKLSYAAVFFLYGVAVVWALITHELLRGAERASAGDERRLEAMRGRADVVTTSFLVTTSAVALFILLATSVVFVLFPRVGFQSFGLSSGGSKRLPPTVSLRGVPRASVADTDVVARVTGVSYDAFLRGLYLRGVVYDTVDEQGFSRSERAPKLRPSALALADGPEDGSYDVFLSPGAGTTLLALGHVRGVFPLSGGRSNPNDKLYIRGADQRTELHAVEEVRSSLRYRVQGSVAAPASVPEERGGRAELLPGGEGEVFFALPKDFDPKLIALADEVTAGATDPVVVAERLRTFLLREFEYSLEQPNADKDKPLSSFLLEDRRGHCEYFASAFALLLRARGIGARVIGGYQGGAWDSVGEVVVFTGGNAHAWVEWFLPGAGWIVDDATPLATSLRSQLTGVAAWLERLQRFWDDRVLDYALGDQVDLARRVQRALSTTDDDDQAPGGTQRMALLLVVGAAGVALGVLAWRRRRGRVREGGAAHDDVLVVALLAALARCRGTAVPASETLREAAASLPALSPAERAVLERALRLYEGRRFAGHLLEEHDVRTVAAALSRVPATDDDGPSGTSPRGPVSP